MHISSDTTLEQWQGSGGWFFVRLPKDTYDDLKEIGQAGKRGFGAIRVDATIESSTWQTSIFPDSEDKSYILFVKKAIRQAEQLELGDAVTLNVALVDAG